MQIEKNIAFLINQQFPAIYRENGPELVGLVEEYYNFMETNEKQSGYVGRRIFEYKDIATTITSMMVFFQQKYMADLPYKEDTVRLISRNIMDLYRRKGTKAGIELFFSAFFNEQIEIFYPASKMFKPSDSKWKTGVYLQMFPNSNYFVSDTGLEYSYNDLIGRNIRGSNSGAEAVVDNINFIILNGISTAIIYIEENRGTFNRFDDIITNINSEAVYFGRTNGSLSQFVVTDEFSGTSGNEVGDILNISSEFGFGGKAIVTEVSEDATGQVALSIVDGGYGYTVENTQIIISDQIVVFQNTDLIFEIGERVTDGSANGTVIGQNEISLGVKMDAGEDFTIFSIIETVDRAVNITLDGILKPTLVTVKNLSASADIGTITNATTVTLITDPIAPFLQPNPNEVFINSADYKAEISPSLMSGAATPVNLTTPIDQAFALETFTIGTIDSLTNINPGTAFENDTFVVAVDNTISQSERYDQIISISTAAAAGQFSIGEIIQEEVTGVRGIVRSTNLDENFITVTPYSYYGFNGINNVLRGSTLGTSIAVSRVDDDYSSRTLGNNANLSTLTEFAIGRISEVAINNSGFGYVDMESAFLLNDAGQIQGAGIIEAVTQGKTSGFWTTISSHLNGFKETDNVLNYYDSGMKLQDSDYYQEYSYEIQSTIGIERYETLVRENVHLAGSKLFSKFSFKKKVGGGNRQRFVRIFNEDGDILPATLTTPVVYT